MKLEPRLSAVVVTPAGFDVVAKTVAHLRTQEGAEKVELVVVGPAGLEVPSEAMEGFCAHRLIELEVETTGQGMAAGFEAASAPLLAYVEEHSYPQPGWAQALLEAHAGPWAAVGVTLENANPGTLVSWASLFLDFGPAVERAVSGEAAQLPSHHTCFKRAALEGHDERLRDLLEVEAVLQAALRERGDRLYASSAARQSHVHISRLRKLVLSEFNGGLQYAPLRIRQQRFSLAHRLAYAAAAPAIVAVQLWRTIGHVRRAGRSELLPRLLPYLLLGLVTQQIGETLGYLTGRQSGAPQARKSVELNRAAHVREADAEALR